MDKGESSFKTKYSCYPKENNYTREVIILNKVNLSDFELVLPPQNREDAFNVNICPSGYVNINGKLMQNIKSSKMALWVNQNGKQILLAEQEESSFRLPKSGSIKAIDFTRDYNQTRYPSARPL